LKAAVTSPPPKPTLRTGVPPERKLKVSEESWYCRPQFGKLGEWASTMRSALAVPAANMLIIGVLPAAAAE